MRSPFLGLSPAVDNTGQPVTLSFGPIDVLAELEPSESTHDHVLAELGYMVFDQPADRLLWILDERLFEQDHLLRIGLLVAILFDAGREYIGRNLVNRHEPRIGRRNLHGDVMCQGHEIGRPGYEVSLAIDLDHDSNPAVSVNVGLDKSLRRHAV